MIIGVPREIKPGEQRVALTPAGVRALVEAQAPGGGRAGRRAGQQHPRRGVRARAAPPWPAVEEVWARAEMILKVKEPLPEEYARMRPGQILFTYLHLAAVPELARALQAAGVVAIAYETVQRARRQPAPARADERGGRAPVGAGGRVLPGQGPRRPRDPARGRARRAARQRGGGGRGRRRGERGAHRARPGRRRLDPRREPRPPARGGRSLPRPGDHARCPTATTSTRCCAAPICWSARCSSPARAPRCSSPRRWWRP